MDMNKYEFLPKNLSVFFAQEGLSMSEANHTANMINQINVAINARILNANAIKETLTFDGKEIEILRGQKEPELLNLCQREGTLYGLSAWLREAVKAKDSLLQHIRIADAKDFMVEEGDVVPEFDREAPAMSRLPKAVAITEDHVLATFSIAERSEIFQLEAEASHIGKKIHSTGQIDRMRNSIMHFSPFRMQSFNDGAAKKDYPVTAEIVYTQGEIDVVYFELQKKHREVESKLNWYKAKIKNDVNAMQAEANKNYTLLVQETTADYDKNMLEYTNKRKNYINDLQKMQAVAEERRIQLISEVSKLKVVVPNRFVDQLAYVQTYNGN